MTQNYYQARPLHPPMGHLANRPVIPPRSQFPKEQQLPFHPQQQQQQSYQSSYSPSSSSSSSYSQGGLPSRSGSTGNHSYGTNNGKSNYSHSSNNSNSSSSSLRSNASTPSVSSSSSTTASSFQERMKERDRENRQRERQERDAAARAIREDPNLNIIANGMANAPAGPAQSTGTTIWNRLRAAKDIINTTITGEERWPDSDDSDHEGESHVMRTLRELNEKREADEIAQKISELEMTPYNGTNKTLAKSPSVGSFQSSHSGSSGRNQYLRDAARGGGAPTSPTSPSSPAGGQDYYGRLIRARGESSGHQQSRSEDTSIRRMRTRGESDASNTSSNNNVSGNRYRTASDASRDEALSRLEGKRTADVLNAQISHLGSTSPRARANSPHRGPSGRRPVPAPPSVSSPPLNDLGAYGQRKQLQQQT
ncbi:hypothetical protein CPB97_000969, partial [Podila verticillata]